MKKLKNIIFAIIILSNIKIAKSQNETQVVLPNYFGISKPLSELFDKEVDLTSNKNQKNIAEMDSKQHLSSSSSATIYTAKNGKQFENDPATIQNNNGTKALSAPIQNWLGQMTWWGIPDPSGAAGPNHYVQAVNPSSVKIFDKNTGNQLGLISDLGQLWNPAVTSGGDVVVLYDKYADRWLIIHLEQWTGKLLMAISTSSNPTGTYYLYKYGCTTYPDYPKISIWSDGYYMTINDAFNRFNGISTVYVFERAQMLIGNPTAKMLRTTFPRSVNIPPGFWCPLPADADGILPPAGLPCPFFYYTDNSFGTGAIDAIEIRNMTTSWANDTLYVSTPIVIPTAAFDASYVANSNSQHLIIPQANGSDTLSVPVGSVMYRAQWRKWVGYNSVVLNWEVKVTPNQNSIKWAELRQDQNTLQWSLYQEGIYAPDALNRWMGSIAMDDNGSIGFSYAVSGPNPTPTSPSLRYTGRLKNDPLGQMTFSEQTAIAGSGVMPAAPIGHRFGDYAHTSIDPSDGLTFWHTGEYVENGQQQTRIYSFQLNNSSDIEENKNQIAWNIFPDNGLLNCTVSNLPTNENVTLTLFNILGETIIEQIIHPAANKIEISLNTRGYAKGTYLVRIGNVNFQKVKKVILN